MIKDTLEEFDKEFIGDCPQFHDPNTHANYPTVYVEKMLNIKEIKRFFLTSHISYLDEKIKQFGEEIEHFEDEKRPIGRSVDEVIKVGAYRTIRSMFQKEKSQAEELLKGL